MDCAAIDVDFGGDGAVGEDILGCLEEDGVVAYLFCVLDEFEKMITCEMLGRTYAGKYD